MKDYHVHSNFSDDCTRQPLIQACEAALAKGINEIAFTEHVDIDYPIEKGDFQLDYENYSKQIEKARSLFPNLTILKGLELGMQATIDFKMESYLREHKFDFVLGSIHTVDGLELHGGDFSLGKDSSEAIRGYFEAVLLCLKSFANFHVLAHLDLIRRYIDTKIPCTCYKPYYELIDEIFNIIIDKGIGLEINTSGWRYGVGDFLPGKQLLERYKYLGGEIITFGSDAHRHEQLGYKFNEAYILAKEVGFTHYAYYRQGKPDFTLIP